MKITFNSLAQVGLTVLGFLLTSLKLPEYGLVAYGVINYWFLS